MPCRARSAAQGNRRRCLPAARALRCWARPILAGHGMEGVSKRLAHQAGLAGAPGHAFCRAVPRASMGMWSWGIRQAWRRLSWLLPTGMARSPQHTASRYPPAGGTADSARTRSRNQSLENPICCRAVGGTLHPSRYQPPQADGPCAWAVRRLYPLPPKRNAPQRARPLLVGRARVTLTRQRWRPAPPARQLSFFRHVIYLFLPRLKWYT